jgi:hypothetical protein
MVHEARCNWIIFVLDATLGIRGRDPWWPLASVTALLLVDKRRMS